MTQTEVLESSTTFGYVGSELELFAQANRWKAYLRERIGIDTAGEVLEVGAGIGGTTAIFCAGRHKRWVCLEPDPVQASEIASGIERGTLPRCCETRFGTLADCVGESFDALLYIDVLEHIEDDQAELHRAAALLHPGGRLVVLSPAHNGLFTPFDQAVGHYRRYNKKMIRSLRPEGLELRRLDYLDAAGLIASLANRLILRQAMPTSSQIKIWDDYLVPLSRILDPWLHGCVGKSILAVWEKPRPEEACAHP